MPGEKTPFSRAIDKLIAESSPDLDYIQIDDMRFLKADILEKSGFSGTEWSGGIVYYTFDANVTPANQELWLAAAAQWYAAADVIFTARTSQTHYIHVKNDSGNWSYLGMVGGKQEMGIANWGHKFVIVHEIGHALGLSHEHSRSDRDGYVTILWDNIPDNLEYNFTKDLTTNHGGYDFDSVMHYFKTAFSSNGENTVEPTAPYYDEWIDKIGQQKHLSTLDKAGMAWRYGSPSTNPLPQALDNDTLVFTTGGDGDWFGQPLLSNQGGSSAMSGDVDDNGSTWLQTTLAGPGQLSFYWRVSSEGTYDFLEFHIDGVLQPGKISGSVDWVQKAVSIPAGSHTIRWVYNKDRSVDTNSDGGWVDGVVFTGSGKGVTLSPIYPLLD